MENPNEKTNPEREFEICIDYRLSRIAKVTTDNYIDSIDEDGCRCIDASANDWQKEYESKYMTPLEMIEAFKEFVPVLTEYYHDVWMDKESHGRKQAVDVANKVSTLLAISRSLDGWEETFDEAHES